MTDPNNFILELNERYKANSLETASGVHHSTNNTKLNTSAAESVIVQKSWENFVQIMLTKETIIIGQIIDISAGQLTLKVAYHFDLIDSIPVTLTLSIRKPSACMAAYDTFQINSSIVQTKALNESFSLIGLIYASENESSENKIKSLINQVSA